RRPLPPPGSGHRTGDPQGPPARQRPRARIELPARCGRSRSQSAHGCQCGDLPQRSGAALAPRTGSRPRRRMCDTPRSDRTLRLQPPGKVRRNGMPAQDGEMTEASEIRTEPAKLDDLYARLDQLREETTARLGTVRISEVGGDHQHRTERDAFATLYEDQLIRLDGAEEGLCFGRLDLVDEDEPTYIGRIGLTDADRQQMLIDWRAPAAERFYQSTAANPEGVARRRHLVTGNRLVTGIEDDVLDIDALDDAQRSNLQGEGALLAALTSHRTGRMGDIVATIQSEQDAIIRRPLSGVLVVQGGPGTGKTAVALHRAAYLLYRHRERIAKSGVLLVGPSTVFLKYIEKVLPSLGETGAVLLT